MDQVTRGLVSNIGFGGPEVQPRPSKASKPEGPSFAEVLKEATERQSPARFSRHARERVEERGIEMTPRDLSRLDGAIARAKDKGSRSALVLIDGRAFIVGPQSGTVITAIGGEDLESHVFTNIDATVVA